MKTTLLVLAALAGVAGPALAVAPEDTRSAQLQARLHARFAAADTNGDGHLTPAEAEGKMPFVYRNFAHIDGGSKGYVTPADIGAFVMKQRASRQDAGE